MQYKIKNNSHIKNAKENALSKNKQKTIMSIFLKMIELMLN